MKPRLLLVSTAEDLHVASELAERLRRAAEVVTWAEDVFALSQSAGGAFERMLDSADLSVILVRPSPVVRGRADSMLNGNIAFEIGMCIGRLGSDRTTLLVEQSRKVNMPSDLRGFAYHTFNSSTDASELRSSLSHIASALNSWVKRKGRRAAGTEPPPSPAEVVAKDVTPVPAKSSKKEKPGKAVSNGRSGVFISYSHADDKWLVRIKTMLTPLVRIDQIDVWDDTRMKAGSKWRKEINTAIATAKVALLLVSPNFLASRFIQENELPPILDAARDEGLTIVWALISPCFYKKTAIAEYQAAHSIAKPLETLPANKRNAALLQIAETISAALDPK